MSYEAWVWIGIAALVIWGVVRLWGPQPPKDRERRGNIDQDDPGPPRIAP